MLVWETDKKVYIYDGSVHHFFILAYMPEERWALQKKLRGKYFSGDQNTSLVFLNMSVW